MKTILLKEIVVTCVLKKKIHMSLNISPRLPWPPLMSSLWCCPL